MGPTPKTSETAAHLVLHATTIVLAGQAALLRGPSGSGKSSLALQLIALGALLVADDRTCLSRRGEGIVATAPETANNRIEARYVGILKAPSTPSAPLALIVDMAQEEKERLPSLQHETLLGLSIPVIRKTNAPHFPASVALYLQGERTD
ncbi:MAG: HPr kinase/phosphatase C-terminal domain-containing protein [Pseudomonadota bacterium]